MTIKKWAVCTSEFLAATSLCLFDMVHSLLYFWGGGKKEKKLPNINRSFNQELLFVFFLYKTLFKLTN